MKNIYIDIINKLQVFFYYFKNNKLRIKNKKIK